jgi:transposase
MSGLTNTLSCPYERIIGCDVGKSEIVWNDHGSSRTASIANEREDLQKLAQGLGADCLVICEATGGYEAVLLEVLVEAGIPVHRADAVKAKAFMRSFGTLGKTDALDAKALARYGAERWSRLALWTPCSVGQVELERLVARRQELVAMRAGERARAGAPLSGSEGALARSFKAILKALDAQILALDEAIAALTARDEELATKMKSLQSLKGVGTVTASSLCALMSELGTLTGKQAAALAGLAPHPHESGDRQGYRKIRGGRPLVRRTLFMAAMSAVRRSGTLKDFYDKLVQRGKKKIVALTAVMRKMIVILNARVRDALAPSNQAKTA